MALSVLTFLILLHDAQRKETFASSYTHTHLKVDANVILYRYAHHVPHAEHVESLIRRNGEARSTVEMTPCCPPPILFTGQ